MAGLHPHPPLVERVGTFSRRLHITACWLAVIGLPVWAVMVPVCAGVRGHSPWEEGRVGVGPLRQGLEVIKAENSGRIPESVYDDAQLVDWDGLDCDAMEWNGQAFAADDYFIVITDRERGRYLVGVGPSSVRTRPDGAYVINEDGENISGAP